MTAARKIHGLPPLPTEMRAAAADAVEVLTLWLFQEVRLSPPTTKRKARFLAQRAVALLRDEDLIPGTGARVSAEARIDSLARNGMKPIRGISHLVAEAIVLLDLDEVHRDTIYSLLPDRKESKEQANKAIRKFDQWGWIHRTQEGTIRVLDADGLTNWFTAAEDSSDAHARTVFNVAAAIQLTNAATEASDSVSDRDLRRRELLAMRRLMETAPGSVTNARGTVRIVPKAATL